MEETNEVQALRDRVEHLEGVVAILVEAVWLSGHKLNPSTDMLLGDIRYAIPGDLDEMRLKIREGGNVT